MTEQLGVEWTNDHRIEVHVAQLAKARATLREKIVGVFVRRRQGRRRIVKFLFVRPAAHAMILEAAKFPNARRMQKRPQLFLRSIESDVAIEIAVNGIARITGFARSRLRDSIDDRGRRPPDPPACSTARRSRAAVAAGQTSGRGYRGRTSGCWLPAGWTSRPWL